MLKIVSGGQTGVDRAALDAAIQLGLPHGGYCPQGRRAEDGAIPERYPLVEVESPAPLVRTERNVVESDATLILHGGQLVGGTRDTRDLCGRHGRPCLVQNYTEIFADGPEPGLSALTALTEFVERHRIETLNVAGPRASEAPDAYHYARAYLTRWLGSLPRTGLKPG